MSSWVIGCFAGGSAATAGTDSTASAMAMIERNFMVDLT